VALPRSLGDLRHDAVDGFSDSLREAAPGRWRYHRGILSLGSFGCRARAFQELPGRAGVARDRCLDCRDGKWADRLEQG
jgi:hypothetical protein